MKHIVFLVALFISFNSHSQALKRLANRAKQKVENVAGNKVENAIDNATDSKKKNTTSENDEATTDGKSAPSNSATPTLKAYSRYDFVPGEKIVYAEDFSQDVIGEFPLKWNTNGSGEIVNLEGTKVKWLQMTEGTEYTPGFSTKLPDNYTIEFDLMVDFKDDQRVPAITFKIFQPSKKGWRSGIEFGLDPNNGTYSSQGEQTTNDRVRLHTYDDKGQYHLEGKDQLHAEFTKFNHKTIPVHVSLWVQKERLRAWVNQAKVYDLPKAILPNAALDRIGFEIESYGGDKSSYQYYLTNVKIAVAPPDTRSKLITEGKFVTTGITFDVNSDKIKPTSYGTLKDIANVLSENPNVKVKIIGHTDSDGDAAKNVELSKKRAAAVKAAFISEFKIDETRMDTDGVGATKPLGDNKTAEGKAQNRRVEFVKI